MLAKTAALVADVTASMDAYDLYGACSDDRLLPRRAHQLVRAQKPRPLLAGARRISRGRKRQARRLRHPVHGALDPVQGRRSSAPDAHRVGLPGSHRRAKRPSRRLAVRRRARVDPRLVAEMELVREVCSAGHAIRKASDKRLRLPLRTSDGRGARAHELARLHRADRRRGERERGRPHGRRDGCRRRGADRRPERDRPAAR